MELRIPYARTGDDMDLPEGKTCADCVHCRRCTMIFGHIPEDESCDWAPSRFREKDKKDADADFIAAMSQGLPPLPKPDGLMSIDCTGILTGNADLELSDLERIEGICALPTEDY